MVSREVQIGQTRRRERRNNDVFPLAGFIIFSNEGYSNRTCGLLASIDYRELDSHIKKAVVLLLKIKLKELLDVVKLWSTCQA